MGMRRAGDDSLPAPLSRAGARPGTATKPEGSALGRAGPVPLLPTAPERSRGDPGEHPRPPCDGNQSSPSDKTAFRALGRSRIAGFGAGAQNWFVFLSAASQGSEQLPLHPAASFPLLLFNPKSFGEVRAGFWGNQSRFSLRSCSCSMGRSWLALGKAQRAPQQSRV